MKLSLVRLLFEKYSLTASLHKQQPSTQTEKVFFLILVERHLHMVRYHKEMSEKIIRKRNLCKTLNTL